MEVLDNWATTEVEREKFSFRWSLSNYSAISKSEVIKSPAFKSGPKSKSEWYLRLSPKKIRGEGEYFEIFLILKHTHEEKISAEYSLSLLNNQGECLGGDQKMTKKFAKREFTIEKGWGLSEAFQSFYISDLVAKNQDKLQIFCEISVDVGTMKNRSGYSKTNDPIKFDVKENGVKFAAGLKSFYETGALTDVELCIENTETSRKFRAHKIILSVLSPVFTKMFQTDMVESTQNRVVIPDFKEEVLEAMLIHVYGGTAPNIVELAPELFQIAEKYHLDLLKLECEAIIEANVSVETAGNALNLAKKFNSPNLKRKLVLFINQNKAKFQKTEQYADISTDNLKELYEAEDDLNNE